MKVGIYEATQMSVEDARAAWQRERENQKFSFLLPCGGKIIFACKEFVAGECLAIGSADDSAESASFTFAVKCPCGHLKLGLCSRLDHLIRLGYWHSRKEFLLWFDNYLRLVNSNGDPAYVDDAEPIECRPGDLSFNLGFIAFEKNFEIRASIPHLNELLSGGEHDSTATGDSGDPAEYGVWHVSYSIKTKMEGGVK